MLINKVYAEMPKSAAMDILMYIVSNTDPDTKVFSRTYEDIQKATGASRDTISRTIARLAMAGIIQWVGNGKWYNSIVDGWSKTCNGPDWYVNYLGQK